MQEIIPKKNRQLPSSTQENIPQLSDTVANENDPFIENNTSTITSNTISKDVVMGKIIKNIRQTGDGLLFAMLSNIKDYEIVGNNFVVTCDQLVNYQDITSQKNIEIFNNIFQKIDLNLNFQVKLKEDKTAEISASNIKKLEETFGKLIKFKK